jgi:pyruvate dehydrogenase E2 component (dihydrolipoamide acetyltransferase)
MGTRLHGWRRLAAGAWGPPNDPQFYGDLEVDAAVLQSYLVELRRRTHVHVTVTHLVGKAIAHGLVEVPELGVRLWRGREYRRESTDVFFIVSDDDQLTGVKIASADGKSVVDIARELETRVLEIRAGNDEQLGKTKALMEKLPGPVLKAAIALSSVVTSGLNLDLPQLGLPRQAFGGTMVTSVGGWGVSHAYSPLAAYYRVPLLVLVGAVQEKPVVVAGRVVARPMLGLTATFDHRYCDGLQAVKFAEAVRTYLSHPAAFDSGVGTVDLTEGHLASSV